MIHPYGLLGLAAGVMAVTAGSQFVEDHTVRLPTVCAVGAVVLGGAWKASSTVQRFEDRFDSIEKKLNELWCIRHPEKPRPTESKTKNEQD